MIPLVPPLTLIMQLITLNRVRAPRRAPTAVQATARRCNSSCSRALYSLRRLSEVQIDVCPICHGLTSLSYVGVSERRGEGGRGPIAPTKFASISTPFPLPDFWTFRRLCYEH